MQEMVRSSSFKLGCIGTGTTRSAQLSENRRYEFTPLDRLYQDRVNDLLSYLTDPNFP